MYIIDIIYVYNIYLIIILYMKTQVTLTVDADVKNEFKKIASDMWANMSTLVNMYFTQVVKTGKVEFFYNDRADCSNLDHIFETEKLTKKEKKDLESLSNFNKFIKACSWK